MTSISEIYDNSKINLGAITVSPAIHHLLQQDSKRKADIYSFIKRHSVGIIELYDGEKITSEFNYYYGEYLKIIIETSDSGKGTKIRVSNEL